MRLSSNGIFIFVFHKRSIILIALIVAISWPASRKSGNVSGVKPKFKVRMLKIEWRDLAHIKPDHFDFLTVN